jgi:hypothetical protein
MTAYSRLTGATTQATIFDTVHDANLSKTTQPGMLRLFVSAGIHRSFPETGTD